MHYQALLVLMNGVWQMNHLSRQVFSCLYLLGRVLILFFCDFLFHYIHFTFQFAHILKLKWKDVEVVVIFQIYQVEHLFITGLRRQIPLLKIYSLLLYFPFNK